MPWPLNIVLNRWGRYRRAADRIFSEANQASGVSAPLRVVLNAGVRIGAVLGIGMPRGS